MTAQTKRLFQRVGDAPKQRRGHTPTIHIAGCTIKVFCSCGVKLQGGTGCNRSGMDYVISWGKASYQKHVAAKKAGTP